MEAPLDIKDVIYILLLQDINDEHYAAKYPLIDIEPISWIMNGIFSNSRHYKPFCYQSNGTAWRIMLPTAYSFQLSRFSTTHCYAHFLPLLSSPLRGSSRCN